jgi:hypothetical protein
VLDSQLSKLWIHLSAAEADTLNIRVLKKRSSKIGPAEIGMPNTFGAQLALQPLGAAKKLDPFALTPTR